MFISIINAFYIIINRVITCFLMKFKTVSYIAMFHDIVNSNNIDDCITEKSDVFSVTTCDFEEYIKYCRENGRKFIRTVNDFTKYKSSVMITFDDGFKSIITIVLPIMKKYNIPFTIFITVNYIGEEGYLTWDDLSLLSQEPLCTIGSHSVSHAIFREMNDDSAAKEFFLSKETLEKNLNIQVDDFAFPFGSIYAVSNKNCILAKHYYKNIYMTYQKVCSKNREFWPRLDMSYFIKRRLL